MPWSEYYKREYGILKWEAPAPEPNQPMVIDLSMSYLNAEQKRYLLNDLKRTLGMSYTIVKGRSLRRKRMTPMARRHKHGMRLD
jgi:hypothetical protein